MPLTEMIVKKLVFLSLLAAAVASCGSEESPPSSAGGGDVCGSCATPATIDLMTPAVSFQTDIFDAILRPTCNASTCHGVPLGRDMNMIYPMADLYLGPDPTNLLNETIDAALRTSIVANLKAQSKTVTALKIVEPGNLGASFLVTKIYACQQDQSLTCDVQSEEFVHCDDSPCGDPMPPISPKNDIVQLTEAQKDTFRRWIAQGALDN